MEQKEKKEKSDAEERERLLISQLDNFGGLWDLDVIDAKLSKLSSEKKKTWSENTSEFLAKSYSG